MTPTHGDDDVALADERRGHSRSYQARGGGRKYQAFRRRPFLPGGCLHLPPSPPFPLQGMSIGFVLMGGIISASGSVGGSGGVFNPALGAAIVVRAPLHAPPR